MSETYEILALRYAQLKKQKRRNVFVVSDAHDDILMPLNYFIWVIRNANRTVVVDVGFDETMAKARGRQHEREPAQALKMIGLPPEDVETVVISHMHYDHAGTLTDFPNAIFHLQEQEMAYATGACMTYHALRHPYECEHVVDMVRLVFNERVRFHAGDAELAPGITLHLVGGHAKGLQVVRVMTDRGPMVLASDASHFYENYLKYDPFVIVHDMEATLRGYDQLRALSGGDLDRIIPGHDPLVMQRYPAVEHLENIAVRLDLPPNAPL